jgi:Na+-transporting NADH:ubiquinone oxidoreductase subunit NqrB
MIHINAAINETKKQWWSLRDPRHFQILFFLAFISYGLLKLGWSADLEKFGVIIGVALLTQFVFLKVFKKGMSSLKSAMITALGLCMLLQADQLWIYALAAFIGIASKFLVRVKHKHIFNPANLGIVSAILITGQAWVSPGQWGNSTTLVFFMIAAGLMVLLGVGRIDTSVVFFLTYLALIIARDILYLGWGWDVVLHKISNGTFLLFTFFMITDPMTIPNHRKSRIIWSALMAGLVFVFAAKFYVHTSAIWVLFFISPLTPFFDMLFKAKKYEWRKPMFNSLK